eukprot:gene29411-10963_t
MVLIFVLSVASCVAGCFYCCCHDSSKGCCPPRFAGCCEGGCVQVVAPPESIEMEVVTSRHPDTVTSTASTHSRTLHVQRAARPLDKVLH